ncbi:hypothetical protein HY792_05315 [Candidatus Desantisbacteria bacterium]|nr:hypothetical protein [Candidatus Desantisbacteria bacterium]
MKRLLLISIISLSLGFWAHILLAQESNGKDMRLNISGMKAVEGTYIKFKGKTPPEPEGINIKQSLRFLIEGGLENRLNTRLNYDDTQEQPLQMLINYQGDAVNASFGDIDVVLDETEFALYNKRLFGISAGAALNNFNVQTFGAKTKGVSKSKVYRGKIGSGEINLKSSNYIPRTYYQLLNENVTGIYVDDGIQENGTGFDLQQISTDYTMNNGILIFREQVEENSIVQVVYENSGTRTIKSPTISTEIRNYYYLGYPNIVDNSEIVKVADIPETRNIDYIIDYAQGILHFVIDNDWTVSLDYRVKDYQLDPPVLTGSEKVKVDDKEKTRGVDYYINYESGTLYFYDEHLAGIYDDSLIVIDYESSGAPNLQNMLGLRPRYQVNKNWALSATYLLNTDEEPKTRPKISTMPLQHQIIGVDTQIQSGENVKFSAELAMSKRKPEGDKGIFIDDMEGENLVGQQGRWKNLDKNVTLKPVKDTPDVHHPDELENYQVLRMEYGAGTGIVEQQFQTPVNLARHNLISAWIKSNGQTNILLQLYSATEHYFTFNLTPDTSNQYCLVSKDLLQPLSTVGNPRLDEINRIRIVLQGSSSTQTIIYLDDIRVKNGNSEEGLASKCELEIKHDIFNLKTCFKDIEKGFSPIGRSDLESISDTRYLQSQASLNIWGHVALSIGYDEKLRDKSSLDRKLQNKIYSYGLSIKPSEQNIWTLENKQENEIDCKETHQVNNLNNKFIASITYNKEKSPGLNSYQLFTRLMRVDTKDKAHDLHTNSDQGYMKLNLIPLEGITVAPEYKYKNSYDIKKSLDLTKELGFVTSLDITAVKGLTTILRYTNENLKNFLVKSEQKNQGKSIALNVKLGTYRPYLTPYASNIFYESVKRERIDASRTSARNEAVSSNIKLKITPLGPWDALLQYQLTRQEEKVYLSKNKTDNYLSECNLQLHKLYPQFGKIVNLSKLTTRYEQRKSRNNNQPKNSINIYLLAWQTEWKTKCFSCLQYEQKDEQNRTMHIPYIKLKYTPFPKLQLNTEFRETVIKQNVKSTTDYFTSLGTEYQVKKSLLISEIFRYSRNESDNKKSYSSALSLKWGVTSKVDAMLRYDWTDVHDRIISANDFSLQRVSLNLNAMF